MKTKEQILEKIERLNKMRLIEISNRDQAKDAMESSIAHNLVVAYAMQQEALEWVLKND